MHTLVENLHPLIITIIILLAKTLELSLAAIKTVFISRREKLFAVIFGFIECAVWALIVSAVITSLTSNILWLVGYCLGYSLGIYIGLLIEEKIALGIKQIEFIVDAENLEIIEDYLKKNNYGFYVTDGYSKNGGVFVLKTVVQRKDENKLLKEIGEIAHYHFFTSTSDIDKTIGGYGLKR
jgi:uncharacterized protein YebE (UPF0316 family)